MVILEAVDKFILIHSSSLVHTYLRVIWDSLFPVRLTKV